MKKIYLLFTFAYLLISTSSYAQYTTLLNFESTTSGTYPTGSLLSDGNFLYGMTSYGGTHNLGTVFKIMPNGTGYVKLLDFAGASNGSLPQGALITDGNYLYGMTQHGGANNLGTIFKITPDGTGYVKLLDFAGAASGSYPNNTLFSDGTFLYGMAAAGGTYDLGTIFKIKPDGSNFVKLLNLAGTTNGSGGEGPLFSDGTFLYGITPFGGTNDLGTIFKIMPDGTGYAKLFDFVGGSDANTPRGSLVSVGTFLYGITTWGGTNNSGTIFKIMPDGTGYAKLFDFGVGPESSYPVGSLLFDGVFLYGITIQGGTNDSGTIFRILPNGTGYVKLLDFGGTTNGSMPCGSLISDGSLLYGMTTFGGTNDIGVVFKLGMTTGFAETNIGPEFMIYPNPTKGLVNISTAVSVVQIVSITNILGEVVSSQEVNLVADSPVTMDISEQQAGIYFLRVGNSVKKLIRQ